MSEDLKTRYHQLGDTKDDLPSNLFCRCCAFFFPAVLRYVSSSTSFWKDILSKYQESGQYGVFHACELETSLMLAARPETVRMDLAVDEDPAEYFTGDKFVTVFGPVNAGWRTKDVTKSGVIGAPTYATVEKGNVFFGYAVEKLFTILREISQINY